MKFTCIHANLVIQCDSILHHQEPINEKLKELVFFWFFVHGLLITCMLYMYKLYVYSLSAGGKIWKKLPDDIKEIVAPYKFST